MRDGWSRQRPKNFQKRNWLACSACTDFVGTEIYNRRGEHCSPFFRGASNLYRYIFSVARPVDAGKTDTYCNKVAPAARIYSHLICRKRHLPLKLRKGKTKGGAAQNLTPH